MKMYFPLLIALLAAASNTLVAAELHVPKDHPKIQSAIDAAKAGDTILVAPGTYLERIKLKPGITVRSKGSNEKGKLGLKRAEATIIDGGGEQGKNPGAELAQGATLDGFTITNIGVYDEKKWQLSWDAKGANQSHEHIGGFGVPGVAVTGVNCSIINNIVHHIGDTGIAIRGEKGKDCTPIVSNNVCYRNMGGGIGSMKGSSALISNNICFENYYAGIGHDNANPVVTNNECYGNIRSGIGVSEGACPVVRNNRCYKNRRSGIGIRTGSSTQPVIENNECYENEMSGIGTDEEAEPFIRKNSCHHNKLTGIGCRNHSKPIIVDNHCFENQAAGIGSISSKPIIQGNHCEKNRSAGIGISENSDALVINNRCTDNKMVAMALPGNSSVIAIGNTFTRSTGMPPIIMIPNGSSATLIENTIEGGGVAGIMIQGKATLTKNTLKGSNGGSGIWIRDTGEAVLSGNKISGYKNPVNDQGKTTK